MIVQKAGFLFTIIFSTFISCKNQEKGKVFMLVLDGVIHDFKEYSINMPTLDKIAASGMKAERMIPAFPPDTWTCMTTLATGLYTESHGILSGTFFDVKSQSYFRYKDNPSDYEKNGRFFKNEPLWLTNQKQGGASAIYYFPGYYAFKEKPRYHNNDTNISHNKTTEAAHKAIDDAVYRLKSDDSVNLVIVYTDQPDSPGHRYGKNSTQYKVALEKLDRDVIGYLLEQLNEFSHLNIIVTADHGFIDVKHSVYVDDYLTEGTYEANRLGSSSFFRPINGYTVKGLLANLTKLEEGGHFRVYRKEDLPEYLHYKGNVNTEPLIVLAEREWILVQRNSKIVKGRHGYDISYKDMSTIFYARGPSFKKSVKLDAFESVNVMPLISRILGVNAKPNNGSVSVFEKTLTERLSSGYFHSSNILFVFINFFFSLCMHI